MYPDYPPELNEAQKEYLLSELKDWSITHGLAVRPATSYIPSEHDPSGAVATTAPVTLFPSLFPRLCFDQAKSVAKPYNELYSAIASDEAWLKDIVEELIDIDEFMAGLWKVHLEVKKEGYVQPLNLGLFRSDYMVHASDSQSQPSVRQVEFNTIASSFGGLSTEVSKLHRHLRKIDAYPDSITDTTTDSSCPISPSVPQLALGMAQAHEAYGPSTTHLPLCVIFIIQDPERNVFDQRHLEYALNTTHSVRTFRLQFNHVLRDTRLDADRKLIYYPPSHPHKPHEVSLLYFRAGYSPHEYTDPSAWPTRTHLERSAAIKCPSILTQLAGTKKVQQVLATPQSPHLAHFLPNDPDLAAAVKETFAPIYPLDTSAAGLEARRLATTPETAQRYVLKPQREGGGNNIYRAAIPAFLAALPEPQWPAYVLMEMIEPPAQRNSIFRNGELMDGGIICELGVYGVCLWKEREGRGREVVRNFEAGYLLRTKGDSSEEGGVAAGFGCVDSVALIDV